MKLTFPGISKKFSKNRFFQETGVQIFLCGRPAIVFVYKVVSENSEIYKKITKTIRRSLKFTAKKVLYIKFWGNVTPIA